MDTLDITVKVVAYGVLGAQLCISGNIMQNGTMPDTLTVVTDPAGERYLRNSPRGAGGASGSIYRWLALHSNKPFPEDVTSTPLGGAKYHNYDGKGVIHVLGPYFRGKKEDYSSKQAVDDLSIVYENIFTEFVHSKRCVLRLLPISGGIFSGRFSDSLPQITFQAIKHAFANLTPQLSSMLQTKTIHMCIFEEAALPSYTQFFT